MKDLVHGSLEPWKLSCERGMLLSGFGEVEQLLANQIIERVLQTKAPPDGARRLTLLSPILCRCMKQTIPV